MYNITDMSIQKTLFHANCIRIFMKLSEQIQLKACVRYFLTYFYFSPNDSPSKTMKDVFYFF